MAVRNLSGALLCALLVTFLTFFAAQADAAEPEVAPAPGERLTEPAEATPGAGPALFPKPGAESNAPAPSVGANFLAVKGGGGAGSESGFIPPDTTGAVGPSNVVIPLNGRIKVFSRTGTQQYSADLSDFFSGLAPVGFAFDPRVEFDRATGRWFVIAVDRGPASNGLNNSIMIATSNGSDVAAGESAFTFREFTHSTVIPGDINEFADYPTLAVDANSLLIGTNNFAAGYNSSSLFVVDKSDLIGGTMTVTGFQNVGQGAAGMFTPSVAENDDPTATTSVVVGVDNGFFNVLNFRRVTYPGGVPTLSAQTQISVPATTSSTDDVPAMGSTTPMDALDDRLYEAMIATDPATGEPRLWTAHNMEVNTSGAATATGGRIGSRWYEIGNPLSGTPTVIQSGTLFDSAAANPDSYWIPAIAANGQGHAVIGASVAGPNRFAGIALAQRFAGEPAGTLSPPSFPVAGAGSYTLNDGQGRNRWGDYSQVSIDPTDNMTFWAFQEYVNAVNQWGVRVIEVKAPPPATPSAASPASIPVDVASVDVDVTGTSANGAGFYDPGASFPKRPSAAVSGGVTVNSVTVLDPTTIRLNLSTNGASLGQKTVTITNPDGQQVSGEVLTVADVTPPDTQIDSGPAEGTTIATDSAVLTYSGLPAADTSAFECKLDAEPFAACPAAGTTLAALGEGAHSFEVRAIDASGNRDASPALRSFTVNTKCPPALEALKRAKAKLKKAKAKLKKAKADGDPDRIEKAEKRVKKAKKRVRAAKAAVAAVC